MVAEEKQRVNDALETLVSIKEKSGNLRKDLKNDIHESVSTLWKAFNLICKQLDSVKEEYNSYREEVKNTMKGEGMGGINKQTSGGIY
jgi:galactokinase